MIGPLVDVAWLRRELAAETPQVTVLDVRYRLGGGQPGDYDAGHLPTARYVDLDTALAGAPGRGGRHPLPEPEVFVAAMRAAGVRRDRPVVCYDDWSGHAAARAWWLLGHYGHRQVALLDGGWSAWCAAGGSVETGPALSQEAGDFEGIPGHRAVVDASSLAGLGVLIDARAPERYRGEIEPLDPVAGRIPGSVNVPTADNLAPDGRFRSGADLVARYREVGVVPGVDVGVYCGSGVTACHDLVALELAGITAALYPGSWSEWLTDPERPVERG